MLAAALHLILAISLTRGAVSLNKAISLFRVPLCIVLIAVVTSVAIRPLPAFANDAIDRKVKSKMSPIYPEIARKMGLTGIVKIQLIVAPNGAVKETKVIGGHP